MSNEFNSQLEMCMNCKHYCKDDNEIIYCRKRNDKCEYNPVNANYKRMGGSGSGKTRFLVKPIIIKINESEER